MCTEHAISMATNTEQLEIHITNVLVSIFCIIFRRLNLFISACVIMLLFLVCCIVCLCTSHSGDCGTNEWDNMICYYFPSSSYMQLLENVIQVMPSNRTRASDAFNMLDVLVFAFIQREIILGSEDRQKSIDDNFFARAKKRREQEKKGKRQMPT